MFGCLEIPRNQQSYYCSVAVKSYHVQDNSYKTEHLTGGLPTVWEGSPFSVWKEADRHLIAAVAETCCVLAQQQKVN